MTLAPLHKNIFFVTKPIILRKENAYCILGGGLTVYSPRHLHTLNFINGVLQDIECGGPASRTPADHETARRTRDSCSYGQVHCSDWLPVIEY